MIVDNEALKVRFFFAMRDRALQQWGLALPVEAYPKVTVEREGGGFRAVFLGERQHKEVRFRISAEEWARMERDPHFRPRQFQAAAEALFESTHLPPGAIPPDEIPDPAPAAVEV